MDTQAEIAKLRSQVLRPDGSVIANLKKQKLKIKDEIARLGEA